MSRTEAARLRAGDVVYYRRDGRSRGGADWSGEVLHATPRGGVLIAPHEHHWSVAKQVPSDREEWIGYLAIEHAERRRGFDPERGIGEY